MAYDGMGKNDWELKEKRDFAFRAYASLIINKDTTHEEAVKRAESVVEWLFSRYVPVQEKPAYKYPSKYQKIKAQAEGQDVDNDAYLGTDMDRTAEVASYREDNPQVQERYGIK